MYIKRHIEHSIKELEKMFKTILITGPRQSGKTTFLTNYKSKLSVINFDNLNYQKEAIDDPMLFFKNHQLPLILDEIQRTPEIFLPLKYEIDKINKTGICYMSGSQAFHLMKYVSESLAGRMGIINLLTLSQREKFDIKIYDEFLPTKNYLSKRKKINVTINYNDIWESILKGGAPFLNTNKDISMNVFWQNYISEYIDRDVRDLSQIGNLITFHSFIKLLASQVGSLLNVANIAKELKVSAHTIEHYISILETSHIIYILRPYHNNISKRLIKTPKIYFLDTGLLCNLLGWETTNTLKNGPMAGHIFENYVISEIIKSYYNALNNNPQLYFYRDKDMNEIDLLIERNGTLYPIEIKKHSNPDKNDVKAFNCLKKFTNIKIGEGAIISFYDDIINITPDVVNIPISYI